MVAKNATCPAESSQEITTEVILLQKVFMLTFEGLLSRETIEVA